MRKISSAHSSRKFSSPSELRASGRGRTRRTPAPNVTSAGSGDEQRRGRATYGASMSASPALAVARQRRVARCSASKRWTRSRRTRAADRRRPLDGRMLGARRGRRAACPSATRWTNVSFPATSTTSTRAGAPSPPSDDVLGPDPDLERDASPTPGGRSRRTARPQRPSSTCAPGRSSPGCRRTSRRSGSRAGGRPRRGVADLLEHCRARSTATRSPSVSASTWSCVT